MRDADLALIRAFVEREAHDFKPTKDVSWVDFRMDRIKECLATIKPKSVDYLKIESLGNAGCLTRELILDPPPGTWDYSGKDAVITLCTCGENNCWGNISLPHEEPTDASSDL